MAHSFTQVEIVKYIEEVCEKMNNKMDKEVDRDASAQLRSRRDTCIGLLTLLDRVTESQDIEEVVLEKVGKYVSKAEELLQEERGAEVSEDSAEDIEAASECVRNATIQMLQLTWVIQDMTHAKFSAPKGIIKHCFE